MTTFTAETTAFGVRIVDEYDRVAVPSVTSYSEARRLATLLNTTPRFPGRATLLAGYNKGKRNDKSNYIRTVGGSTFDKPVSAGKPPVINSSKPRGY